jgi:peptide/nickel transport system ATP-binding protein/oligopeptide transport system ATP-binding protein
LSLLSIERLTVAFRTERGETTAIEDVSLSIAPGEILGVVGESGSGKSVTALSVMGLLPEPAARVVAGRVVFEGQVLTGMAEHRLRRLRGPGIGMVFQEPMTSLNPVFSIGEQITETLAAHAHEKGGERSAQKRRERAVEMLERVGIPSASRRLRDYPHQLSGGQRQRVMIAMALACSPRLLIADEPTTALDVTIQASILDLVLDLRDQLGMAVLVITHNMGVIAEVADRVAVMYAGRVVEQAPVEALFAAPGHPYTRALLGCVPALDDERPRLAAIPGSLPDPRARPPGCRFGPRCGLHLAACDAAVPPLLPLGVAHAAACIRMDAA